MTTNKTVTSKFTEIISEGRRFHLKFSDSDMSFELIEFVKVKKWYKQKPVEEPRIVYTGNGEVYRTIAFQMLVSMDSALRDQKENIDKQIIGNRSFANIIEIAEKINSR